MLDRFLGEDDFSSRFSNRHFARCSLSQISLGRPLVRIVISAHQKVQIKVKEDL